MRPLRLLSWSAVALAAALAHTAGGASAVEAPAKPSPAAGNAPGPQKNLNSIPEDGTGDVGIPASSRLVRQILASHPNEDMVICIAGCRVGVDRVVFAVPADPLPPAIAVTQPAAAQPAAAAEPEPAKAAEPVAAAPADTPAPSAKADEANPAAEAPVPAANAEAPAESKPVAKSEPAAADTKKMVPTAAEKDGELAKKSNKSDDADEEESSNKKSSDESEEERSDNDEGENKDKD